MPVETIQLCSRDSLKEGDCKSFQKGDKYFFIVQYDGSIYGYINRCPHLGVNLEWQENQFLDSEQNFIQCFTHGALFNIEDGLCIYGPCEGQSLEPIKLAVINEHICYQM